MLYLVLLGFRLLFDILKVLKYLNLLNIRVYFVIKITSFNLNLIYFIINIFLILNKLCKT